MYFHIEERQAWVRSLTHTVIFDRDPDFARFAQNPKGDIRRIIRVWVAEPKDAHPYKQAYLGAALFFASRFSFSELCLIFRRASVYAAHSGEPARILRHQLADSLRKYIC